MSERKNIAVWTGLVLAVSLLAASITALLLANYYNRAHIQVLGTLFQKIIENQPQSKQAILSVLKEYSLNPITTTDENIIMAYGYGDTDFLQSAGSYGIFCVLAGFFAGTILFVGALFLLHKKESSRIKMLTDYLERVNTGGSGVLFQFGEDNFSKLQDEIYKTVTALYQTRNAAINAKNNFAENLSNIAHQIKTPITAISLSVQMMKEAPSPKHLEQIRGQLSRLTYLEEALLLLSRIDAGTLILEKKEIDVYTILSLAAENLQELFSQANIAINIPEAGEIMINADLDWTMEAVINLFKNCIEHTPSNGAVNCSYEQNPLYTQILIWDNGTGFAKEDIPHIFERFYRGQNAQGIGIGIGLAISKAIIEAQNGTISARNPADGGACFEIRFYSH